MQVIEKTELLSLQREKNFGDDIKNIVKVRFLFVAWILLALCIIISVKT